MWELEAIRLEWPPEAEKLQYIYFDVYIVLHNPLNRAGHLGSFELLVWVLDAL